MCASTNTVIVNNWNFSSYDAGTYIITGNFTPVPLSGDPVSWTLTLLNIPTTYLGNPFSKIESIYVKQLQTRDIVSVSNMSAGYSVSNSSGGALYSYASPYETISTFEGRTITWNSRNDSLGPYTISEVRLVLRT